ncbi:hypothetical protein [Myxococcus hansupus]|nr:hypothetical protein [Myxococcus hansupus]
MSAIRPLGGLSRRAFATLAGVFALSIITLSPGAAHATDEASRITQLRIKIVTGSDDLRTASNAVASLKYANTSGNHLVTSGNLNNGVSWPNNSTRTVTLDMPAGVYMGRLVEFAIQFTSGQPDPFATGDNWNMNGVTVTAILADATEVILVSNAGTPLHRFLSDSQTRWATSF